MFDQLNQEKKAYEKKIIIGIIVTLSAFVLFIPVMITIGFFGFPLIVVPFFGGFLYAAKNGGHIKTMSNNFKEKYLLKELQKVIPYSTYKPFDGFLETDVVRTGLLRNEDRYHSEDMIIGNFEEVQFRTSDIHQQDVRRSDGKTKTRTVFRGRFYEFDFPKSFKSNVLIVQPPLFSWGSSYQKVNTESIHFNSELSVYTDNPHDAFYLLTPHLMERLLYLDKKYHNRLRLSFVENKLFIAINSGEDSFDLKVFKPIDSSIFEEYLEDFEAIIEFIKVLQLDNTLFKKE